MATMASVPDSFGTGGSGISPTGQTPNLKELLQAARVDIVATEARLDTLEGNTGDAKTSVRCASTAQRALTGLTAIDGVTPVAGDRVLLKNQDAGAENGIYVAASGAWSRAADANTSAKVTAGLNVFVSEGTVNGNEWFDLTTDDAITLGTTALTFTKRPTLAELASTAASKGASLVGIQDAGGIITATNVETALAEIKTLVDAGLTISKKTVTVGHADLTDGDTSQTINIGTALPANARVLGVEMHTMTAFSGGGTSALAVDVGTAGDIDALIDGADLFAAVVDGGPATMPAGVRPNKSMGAVQLVGTFVCDGGHVLTDFTAGAVTIDVLYTVLA